MKALVFMLTIGVVATMAGGCATGISSQARSQVTYHGAFEQLLADPAHYRDEVVLIGGKVIETSIAQSGGEIVVLQLLLDGSNRPLDDDRSAGRFVIRFGHFVDPALYPQGKLISVVGYVRGSEVKLIDQLPYRYPVVEPIEMKTWPAADVSAGPRFHFGIGFGTTF